VFDFGFTKKDLVRAVWVFVAAFAVAMGANGGQFDKAALWAAATAGILAVKNFLLADGTVAKG
jgi:hypothetical protein